MSSNKLSLPAFLKILTNTNMPMARAITVASKIYKTHSTPEELGKLTDSRLAELGIDSKDDRKQILAGIKKAGYKSSGAGASSSSSGKAAKPMSPRKRKRDDNVNEFLPDGPRDEGATFGSFEFNEVFDEEILRTKTAVVNRAPVMTAWATVVSERLGFKREEALSIAQAYTEMNAISKGVAIGVFEQNKGKGIELTKGQSQPYIDLMGRRPVYTTKADEWRALVKGEPVEPSSAFSYMSKAFRQTLPHVMGALRLLAASYGPAELNEKGFGLYAEFRPEVDAWGKRAEVKCEQILSLRKARRVESAVKDEGRVEGPDQAGLHSVGTFEEEHPPEETEQPPPKKVKSMTVEEYEAALDDLTYDDLLFNDDF